MLSFPVSDPPGYLGNRSPAAPQSCHRLLVLSLQSFFVFIVPRGLRRPACPSPKPSAYPSPLQLPRAHPVFVESVPVKVSEVYLKGHLKAGEGTPLLAPARMTGSTVRGSQFFPLGEGGRLCGKLAKLQRLQEEPRTPWPPPRRKPLPSPRAAAGTAPQGKGRSAPGLRARRAERKRKARDGR